MIIPVSYLYCLQQHRYLSNCRMLFREVECRWTNGYSFDTALLLSIFLGMFGVDRFYLGYPATGNNTSTCPPELLFGLDSLGTQVFHAFILLSLRLLFRKSSLKLGGGVSSEGRFESLKGEYNRVRTVSLRCENSFKATWKLSLSVSFI